MKKTAALFLLVILVTSTCFCFTACDNGEAGGVEDTRNYAEISIKDFGKIYIEFDRENAPQTVKNFISLADSGFYDGLTLHRVIKDFMIQGGDPNGDGTGGSENEIFGEFSENGHQNNLSHERGVVSMARSEAPNSASSQFFICNADSTHLDGSYAAFATVVSGMDVVDDITEKVFPKTKYADYYGSYEIDATYQTYKHIVWQYLGNGTIVNNADKPVIESIRILSELPEGILE